MLTTLLLLALLLSPAVPAPDYTGAFHRRAGWTGADGAYSVPLGDGRTLWLFGDTLVGPVRPDGSRPPGTVMLHNTVALQDGTDPTTIRFGLRTAFEPPETGGWFWPYDGISPEPGRALVFLGRFEATGEDGAFGFRATGLWLAEVAVGRPDGAEAVRVLSCRPLPFFRRQPDGATVTFGNAILAEGPWWYIYGVRDGGADKRLLVARVPRGRLADPGLWRFWDGSDWVRRLEDAATLATGVSNELSVHREGDSLLLVSGTAGPSDQVQVRVAPDPTGPWSPVATMWRAPEAKDGVFAYNAKAHPELSDDRGLLVSYNVNAFDPERLMRDAGIYRPRFVRLPRSR